MSKTFILHQDIDSWYINKNLLYMLWFDPSLWTIIFDDNEVFLIFDPRYIQRAKDLKNSHFENFFWKKMKVQNILLNDNSKDKIEDIIKGKEVVIESNVPTYFYKFMKKTEIKNLEFIDSIFEEKRLIKDQNEIQTIKKSILIVNKVYKEIEKMAKSWKIIWKKEIELRKIIQKLILDYWWDDESFPSIVAFWKNSAIPHHEAWNTIISNWPLLIDMWVKYNYYLSDFSRNLWIWEKNKDYDEFQKILEIVKSAYQLWEKFIKDKNSVYAFINDENSKIKWSDIDKVIRDYISAEWYWEYFTHSSWHWVWLQAHEKPFLSKSRWNDIIKKWMVIAMEPWIYLPEKFWVRRENTVIL